MEIEIGSRAFAVHNLHLESRSDNHLRTLLLSETVEDARKYRGTHSVLIAGDLNVDLSRSRSSAAVLEREGFLSAIALPAGHMTTPRGFLRHRRTIDWVYLAGPVETISSGVCEDVAASDHYAIWFELKLTA